MSLRERFTLRQVVVTLVVAAVVFPFAAYAAPALVGADESYVVLTGSMRPSIAPGDVVFVTETPAEEIAVGDVITFDRGAAVPTTHRVTEVIEEDGTYLFRTQGDANEDPDSGLVTSGRLIGVVSLTVPFLGTVVTAVDSQYGFLALVVVPFGLLVLDLAYGAVRSRTSRGDGADVRVEDDPEVSPIDPVPGSTTGGTDRIAATVADSELPEVYDAVRAARAYYEAAQTVRVESATANAAHESDSDRGDAALTGRDMTASIAIAALLVGYAAWNAYWQLTTLDAPRPETMSVLSGAIVGLAFLTYLRFTGSGDASRASGGGRSPVTDAGEPVVSPDGGTERMEPSSPASRVVADEEVRDAN